MRPEMKQKWVAATMEQQRADENGAAGGRWSSNKEDASGAAGGAAMSTSELRQQCGGSGRERLHRTAMRAAVSSREMQVKQQWSCGWSSRQWNSSGLQVEQQWAAGKAAARRQQRAGWQ